MLSVTLREDLYRTYKNLSPDKEIKLVKGNIFMKKIFIFAVLVTMVLSSGFAQNEAPVISSPPSMREINGSWNCLAFNANGGGCCRTWIFNADGWITVIYYNGEADYWWFSTTGSEIYLENAVFEYWYSPYRDILFMRKRSEDSHVLHNTYWLVR